ncbi:hypothetical protein DIURU_002901 [Diutina rugosa]|uniref:Transcription factor BYE1 n=1 Tax=Diutina rugosa TaxID=5481 RepID=A0A642UTA1_DIURU|nr:uncharacterized protein DIURU_002901 [Diutina rugosa]KAA8902447.1 hypothetical protein DIURU_002901 [Diutina rugosa]
MRTSSRVNKGQHSKRALDTLYGYDDIPEESFKPTPKRRRAVDEDEVRCTPCGTTKDNYNEDEDEGGTFVYCEACNTWQHAKCMGFSNKIPEQYSCNECQMNFDVRFKSQPFRASTAKAFYAYFKSSFPEDYKFKEGENAETLARKWAFDIESILFKEFPKAKYSSESRRILFLLKKNFMADIQAGTITFAQVVKKTPEQINASIARVKSKLKEDLKNQVLGPSQLEAMRQQQREQEAAEASADNLVVRSVDHRQFSVSDTEAPKIIRPLSPSANPTFVNHDDDDDDDDVPTADINGDDAPVHSDSSSTSSLDSVQTPSTVATEPGASIALSSKPSSPPLWHGTINFPDFASFSASATTVLRTPATDAVTATATVKDIMKSSHYTVEGRLDRSRADAYLDVVKQSCDVYLVKVEGDGAEYQKLYDYLLFKNKVGVLDNRPQFVKDSYLAVVDFRDQGRPQWLRAFDKGDDIGMYVVYVVRRGQRPPQPKFEDLLSQL